MTSTRAASTKPFIGHSHPDFPPRRLPTPENFLCVLSSYREAPKCQKKGPLSFCCPVTKDSSTKCLKAGGCGERDSPCLQLKLLLPFYQAGIVTVSGRAIQKKIVDLNEEYRTICKTKDVMTSGIVTNREKFLDKIKRTWDLTDVNARKVILNDELRTEEAKKEDVAFFDDNFGPEATRKWEMAERDRDYDRHLMDKLLEREAFENRKAERARKAAAQKEKEENSRDSRYKKVPQDSDGECEEVGGGDEEVGQDDERNQAGSYKKEDGDDDSDWEDVGGSGGKKSGRRYRKRRRSGKDSDGGGGGDGIRGKYLYGLLHVSFKVADVKISGILSHSRYISL